MTTSLLPKTQDCSLCVSSWSKTFRKTLQWSGILEGFICKRMKGNIHCTKILSEDIEQFHSVKSSRLFSSFRFLQLVKLTSYKLKEWAVFQWSCSSAVSTVTLPNTQIILLNYGWVAACLFMCCETLPTFGFCSTALTAVAQAQQIGNAPLLISHTLDQGKLCLWVTDVGYW